MKVGPVRRITTDGIAKQNPCVSPDGKQLVFARHLRFEFTVCTMPSGGGEVKQITPSVKDKAPQYQPDWSHDGKRIVYVLITLSGTDGTLHIHTMNPDGSDSKRIITGFPFNMQPVYSPDSAQIAFASTRNGPQSLYVAKADGTDVRRITKERCLDQHPTWSPDGTRLAFDSDRDGPQSIYVQDAEGKQAPARLTTGSWADYYPRWSPDGKKIAFTSHRDSNDEIYVMNADGSEPTNVSNHPAVDKYPAWRPDSKAVLFASRRDNGWDFYEAEIG